MVPLGPFVWISNPSSLGIYCKSGSSSYRTREPPVGDRPRPPGRPNKLSLDSAGIPADYPARTNDITSSAKSWS